MYTEVVVEARVTALTSLVKDAQSISAAYLSGILPSLDDENGDGDLWDDVVKAGLVKRLPETYFREPQSLVWRIEKVSVSPEVWALNVHVNNPDDIELLRLVRNRLGVDDALEINY